MNKDQKTRTLQGVVVCTKMKDTATVLIERVRTHPIYKKKFKVSKKIKVHNPGNEIKVGDRVEINSCRPISKEKHFKILL